MNYVTMWLKGAWSREKLLKYFKITKIKTETNENKNKINTWVFFPFCSYFVNWQFGVVFYISTFTKFGKYDFGKSKFNRLFQCHASIYR